MTKGEYWILDVVLQCQDTIASLKPDDIEMLQLYHNRKWHGLSHAQLVDALDTLFQGGDIIAQKHWDFSSEKSSALYVPARKEIEAEIYGNADNPSDDGYLYYGLTEQGAAKWEQISQPNWNLYLERTGGYEEQCPYWEILNSVSKPLLKQYLAHALANGRIVADTIVWEEFAPWEVTYWKTLPHGYSVQYRTVPEVEYRRMECPDWYTNYFDSPEKL